MKFGVTRIGVKSKPVLKTGRHYNGEQLIAMQAVEIHQATPFSRSVFTTFVRGPEKPKHHRRHLASKLVACAGTWHLLHWVDICPSLEYRRYTNLQYLSRF